MSLGSRRLLEHRIEARPNGKIRIVVEMDRDTALWHPQFGKHWEAYQDLLGKDLIRVIHELRAEDGTVEEGTVHWFDDAKGFGFITTYDAQDIFVHWKGIAGDGFKTLEPGQKVRFKRRMGKLSMEAFSVERKDTES